MMKYIGTVALIVAIVALFTPMSQVSTGLGNKTTSFWDSVQGYKVNGTTVFNSSGQLVMSTTGTAITRINTGTCYIRPYAATIPATSTVAVDCQATAGWAGAGVSALPGVTTGDFVVASLSTSTAGTSGGGVHLIGVSASSTVGFITLHISNETGATFTWPTSGTASGTASYVVYK